LLGNEPDVASKGRTPSTGFATNGIRICKMFEKNRAYYNRGRLVVICPMVGVFAKVVGHFPAAHAWVSTFNSVAPFLVIHLAPEAARRPLPVVVAYLVCRYLMSCTPNNLRLRFSSGRAAASLLGSPEFRP